MKRTIFTLVLCLLFIPMNAQISKDTLNRALVVGYTTAPPFIVKDGEHLEGINIWLWKQIANDLNLDYSMVRMSFSQMLDSLESGSIDISINPLTITSERNRKMRFTDSFYASNSTIAVADISSFQKFVQFVKGFFNQNFLKGLMLLLLIILIFGLIGWYFERQENKAHFRTGYRGIWDGIWWSAVTLTTVGYGDKAPKTRMGKIAALVLMFGGLLFISGLTASIASSLTVTQLNNNPDGFNAFKERPVGSVNNSSAYQFLKEHFFKKVKPYDGVAFGLNGLKNGEIEAFMYDEPILKYRIQEDSTLNRLHILPIKFDVQFYAFALAKDNVELEQAISQRILEIMETREWQVVLSEFGLTEL